MMLQLLHGPAKVASRKKLIEGKQKYTNNNVVVFEEGSDLQTILGSLISPSLFSEPRLIILENPLEDLTADYLTPIESLTLIIWFNHEVSEKKPILKAIKELKGEIFFFPESKEISIFPFLDYLIARDNKAFLEIDKLKKGGFDLQYFLTMVFYLLRNLAVTPKNVPTFVVEKLQRQRKKFDLSKITNLYRGVLEIDFKLKSGLLEKDQAELLLVNLFYHQI